MKRLHFGDTVVENQKNKNISIFSPHLAMKIKTSNPPELQQLQVHVWIMHLLQKHLQTETIQTTISDYYTVLSEIPILEYKNEHDMFFECRNL